jgi:hypothetical protein
MNKEGIATLQHASMGLLCDPRKREEILNDLRVEWVRLVLELELVNIVRRRFPGHSEGAYGRLERCIDELGFIGSDVRFFAQRLWRVIVSWFWAGVFISSHRSDGPLDVKNSAIVFFSSFSSASSRAPWIISQIACVISMLVASIQSGRVRGCTHCTRMLRRPSRISTRSLGADCGPFYWICGTDEGSAPGARHKGRSQNW